MLVRLLLMLMLATSNVANSGQTGQSVTSRGVAGNEPTLLIHAFQAGVSGVRSNNADIRLSVGRDPSVPDEPVLFVEYPGPTGDPAGRDVHCDAENHDWTSGRAISFQI